MRLELAQAQARLGDRTTLTDISFGIESAGVTAIMGRSGIGKTTLLRLIAA